MKNHSEFFLEISKLIASKYGNYTVTTEYKYLAPKSEEFKAALNNFLIPILGASSEVYLVGYYKEWLRDIEPGKNCPDWVGCIDGWMEKRGNLYYFKREFLNSLELSSFWSEPVVYGKSVSTGKRTFRQPGQVVIELPVRAFPVSSIKNHITAVSSLGNLYSGSFLKSKKWIVSAIGEDNLLIPYKDLGSLTFIGSDSTLAELVERIMIDGELSGRFCEFCPSLWLERFEAAEGESSVELARDVYSGLF